MNKADWEARRDSLLRQVDEWETGRKATIGQPVTGSNYARVMVAERDRLEAELRTMGGWGSDRSGCPEN